MDIIKLTLDRVIEAMNPDFSFESLILQASIIRGRPIRLFPCVMDPMHYGFWLENGVYDDIYFEMNTAPVHQNHIICHEIAHVLLGHRTGKIGIDSIDSIVGRTLMRHMDNSYEQIKERQAEKLAMDFQMEIIRRSGLEAMTHRVSTNQFWSDIAHNIGID